MAEKRNWAKMAYNVRDHNLVSQCGFWGGTVWMQLILVHGEHGAEGVIPGFKASPLELARTLRLSAEDEALSQYPADIIQGALSRLESVGLIHREEDPEGDLNLLTWSPEWGSGGSTERVRLHRARKLAKSTNSSPQGEETLHVTACNNGATPVTLDKIRLEEIRLDEMGGVGVAAEPPEPTPKTKRPSEAQRVLAKWAEQAGELWDFQEALRAASLPRSRQLKPTVERLERVAGCVARLVAVDPDRDGIVDDVLADCRAVLEFLATESRARPDQRRWFNGETHWRPTNFDRLLGQVGSPATSAPETAGAQTQRQLQEGIQAAGGDLIMPPTPWSES